eukprot:TRINITY_DN54808_c0_g1_i1.p1 TRINITY_DN54808_c0_g1~~TRINITY_DN54808_c0_g1_i1.p1  ORF type:complete len:200 (+),score=50.72 TRINITY_DN54808_c0_g1_i1:51-602(+)
MKEKNGIPTPLTERADDIKMKSRGRTAAHRQQALTTLFSPMYKNDSIDHILPVLPSTGDGNGDEDTTLQYDALDKFHHAEAETLSQTSTVVDNSDDADTILEPHSAAKKDEPPDRHRPLCAEPDTQRAAKKDKNRKIEWIERPDHFMPPLTDNKSNEYTELTGLRWKARAPIEEKGKPIRHRY